MIIKKIYNVVVGDGLLIAIKHSITDIIIGGYGYNNKGEYTLITKIREELDCVETIINGKYIVRFNMCTGLSTIILEFERNKYSNYLKIIK